MTIKDKRIRSVTDYGNTMEFNRDGTYSDRIFSYKHHHRFKLVVVLDTLLVVRNVISRIFL